jgi:hypothetical protein
MTPSGGLRSVSFPPAPRGVLRSQWSAHVCPAAAPTLSRPWTVAVPSAPLVVLYRPGSRVLPLSGVLTRCANIGSLPQTR